MSILARWDLQKIAGMSSGAKDADLFLLYISPGSPVRAKSAHMRPKTAEVCAWSESESHKLFILKMSGKSIV